MLKSISVHIYYRIFAPLCTSDKLNRITTKPVNLFVHYSGISCNEHYMMRGCAWQRMVALR